MRILPRLNPLLNDVQWIDDRTRFFYDVGLTKKSIIISLYKIFF